MTPESRDPSIGLKRLLQSPQDLRRSGAPVLPLGTSNPSAVHRDLFRAYERDLTHAAETATIWWNSLLQISSQPPKTEKQILEVWIRRPAGPAAHPAVVGVVRQYWLACHALNQTDTDAHKVAPEVFLLQWLVDAGRDELVAVLTCLPYWPIGLSESGNWV